MIREDDTAVDGDKGYASDARGQPKRPVSWVVNEKAQPGHKLAARQRARNHRFGSVRAKVEHVFRIMKCQFGYHNVRYRGIAKNGAQVLSLLALAVPRSQQACVRMTPAGGQTAPQVTIEATNFITPMLLTIARPCCSEVP